MTQKEPDRLYWRHCSWIGKLLGQSRFFCSASCQMERREGHLTVRLPFFVPDLDAGFDLVNWFFRYLKSPIFPK